MNKRAEILIAKYFDQQLSKEEAKELIAWIEKGNKDIFNKYVMINFTIDEIELLRQGPTTDLWENIHNNIHKPKKVFLFKPWKYVGVAASIALLLSLPFIVKQLNTTSDTTHKTVQHTILPGSDKAVLTLEDGKHITLEKGKQYANDKVESNGESLIYNTKSSKNTLAYNYLTIPRGGQFFIELSDGTKVWLNSESKLKYPVSFAPNMPRKVELLYGEAYFDVSESTHHNGAKFIVNTKTQDVEVLGTEFNIKAYNGEHKILTTLVEGKVSVSNGVANKILMPGNQSQVDIIEDNIRIANVDIVNEIAWKNGFFSFENASLKEMLTTIHRWYDVDIVFEDVTKENLRFSGVLKRTETIEHLLKNIELTGRAKFEIKKKQIIVK